MVNLFDRSAHSHRRPSEDDISLGGRSPLPVSHDLVLDLECGAARMKPLQCTCNAKDEDDFGRMVSHYSHSSSSQCPKHGIRRRGSICTDEELTNARREEAHTKYTMSEAVPVTLEYLKSFQSLDSNVGIVSIRTVFVGLFVFFVILLGVGLISISVNYSDEANNIQSNGTAAIHNILLKLINSSNANLISLARDYVDDASFLSLEQVSERIQSSISAHLDSANAAAQIISLAPLLFSVKSGLDMDLVASDMLTLLSTFPSVDRVNLTATADGSYAAVRRLANRSSSSSNAPSFLVHIRPASNATCALCPAASTGSLFSFSTTGVNSPLSLASQSPSSPDPRDSAWFRAAVASASPGQPASATTLARVDVDDASPSSSSGIAAAATRAVAPGTLRGAGYMGLAVSAAAPLTSLLAPALASLRKELAAQLAPDRPPAGGAPPTGAPSVALVVLDGRGRLVASSPVADLAQGAGAGAAWDQSGLPAPARGAVLAAYTACGDDWARLFDDADGAAVSSSGGGLLRRHRGGDGSLVASLAFRGADTGLVALAAVGAAAVRRPLDAAAAAALVEINARSEDTDRLISDLDGQTDAARSRNRTVQIVLSVGVLVCGTILVHFFAVRVTWSLSRLATQMERVAMFDFEDSDSGADGKDVHGHSSASESPLEEEGSRCICVSTRRRGRRDAGDEMRHWVQATSLLSEVAAIGRSFSLMSLNLRSFERYVPEGVVKLLASKESVARLGVAHREVSIMFSDIVGFTTLAESLHPETLIEVLAEYLETMSSCIERSGGTVGKYIGDAIMAFWNSPEKVRGHAAVACFAALEQQRRLQEFRDRLVAMGLPPLRARMGLSCGTVLHGNIGSRRRMEWNLIGDEVNLAARLETMCKQYGVEILISGEMLRKAGDDFLVRRVDRVVAYGRRAATDIYELVGTVSACTPDQVAYCQDFDAVFRAYLARRFAEARDLALAFERRHPGDVPALRCAERCERYLQRPPPDNWDGASVLTSK